RRQSRPALRLSPPPVVRGEHQEGRRSRDRSGGSAARVARCLGANAASQGKPGRQTQCSLMETPGNTCQRLVAALELLVAEEQCVVRSGEIEKIRAVQQRADSIINRLVELRRDPEAAFQGTEPLLPRLAGLQARRVSSIEMMGSRLAEMRATLAALDSARSR